MFDGGAEGKQVGQRLCRWIQRLSGVVSEAQKQVGLDSYIKYVLRSQLLCWKPVESPNEAGSKLVILLLVGSQRSCIQGRAFGNNDVHRDDC